MFDDGRRAQSFSRPDPVVLMVVRLLDGEQLLVCEEDTLPLLSSGPAFELAASLQPYVFVLVREKLHFLELVGLEVEPYYCYLLLFLSKLLQFHKILLLMKLPFFCRTLYSRSHPHFPVARLEPGHSG